MEKIVNSVEIGDYVELFLDLQDYSQTDSNWRVLRNNPLGYARVYFNGGVPARDKFW